MDEVFRPLFFDENTIGREYEREYFSLADSWEGGHFPDLLFIAWVSCAYCCQAYHLLMAGNLQSAWPLIADATFWRGIMLGCNAALPDTPEKGFEQAHEFAIRRWILNEDSIQSASQNGSIKQAASALAKKRHAENYALQEDVKKHWRENIDPTLSAQKAADEVVRAKVVPLSHKKIAEIISRERKAEADRKK